MLIHETPKNIQAILDKIDISNELAVDAAIGIQLQEFAERAGWNSTMKIWPLEYLIHQSFGEGIMNVSDSNKAIALWNPDLFSEVAEQVQHETNKVNPTARYAHQQLSKAS